MNQCANCGQTNHDTSNFCRFCGTKFVLQQMSNQTDYEYSPPSPYSWKTDEFQVGEKRPTKNQPPPQQVQPLNNPYITSQSTVQPPPLPLVYQQPNYMAHGYRCPRCAAQALPTVSRKVSTAGWVTFAVLLATTGIFFWIGLLIKEDVRVCPVCRFRVG